MVVWSFRTPESCEGCLEGAQHDAFWGVISCTFIFQGQSLPSMLTLQPLSWVLPDPSRESLNT